MMSGFEIKCLKCGSTNVSVYDGVEQEDVDADGQQYTYCIFHGPSLFCIDCGNDSSDYIEGKTEYEQLSLFGDESCTSKSS